MSESKGPREQPHSFGSRPQRRIETQIHRRKKAKAVFPLEAEWTVGSGQAPAALRMPPENMNKTKRTGEGR